MNLTNEQWIVSVWLQLNPKPDAPDLVRVMSLAGDELLERGVLRVDTFDGVVEAIARTFDVKEVSRENAVTVGHRAHELAAAQIVRRTQAEQVGREVVLDWKRRNP